MECVIVTHPCPPGKSSRGAAGQRADFARLAATLGLPYYAGLLTAARYYGAAHQQPQVFQVEPAPRLSGL